jgi:5-methyltetrahydrofolate--homocysteine methyltransferase
MPIAFEPEKWDDIRETACRWWAGNLQRPLLYVTRKDRDPGRPEPRTPYRKYAAGYDFHIPAEDIIDRWDWEISRLRFFGDAFPHFWPNFGAGVAAAFLGARVESREETVWFHPDRNSEPAEMEFLFDPENPWFQRVSALMHAAMERWHGSVQVAMTDLGGALDILASFRPGERILLDFYDHPETVKRLTWQIHSAWMRSFNILDSLLHPVNPGYTAWSPIFSPRPYYMLQCDLCYMISPEMFDEFVKPEIAACCRRLAHPFYHLDGAGQLPHLDSLLSIPELKGVQWIPGAGAPGIRHWPEVFRKIRDAGKLIQVFGTFGDLEVIAGQLGSADGIVLIDWETEESESEIREGLAKYGSEKE